MTLSKTYRIWWNSDLQLLCVPSILYNSNSVTEADATAAGIFSSYESDYYPDILNKINDLNLVTIDIF